MRRTGSRSRPVTSLFPRRFGENPEFVCRGSARDLGDRHVSGSESDSNVVGRDLDFDLIALGRIGSQQPGQIADGFGVADVDDARIDSVADSDTAGADSLTSPQVAQPGVERHDRIEVDRVAGRFGEAAEDLVAGHVALEQEIDIAVAQNRFLVPVVLDVAVGGLLERLLGGDGTGKQISAAKLLVARVEQLADNLVDLLSRGLALKVRGSGADHSERGSARVGQQPRKIHQRRIGGRQIRLVDVEIAVDLFFAFEQALQVHDLHRRDGVLAGQLVAFARGQLHLGLIQCLLARLHLRKKTFADERLADSRGRDADNGAHGRYPAASDS